MQKVIVIGSPGAGKSTFSRALKAKTGLPLCYLDMIWHKPDGTNISREEFDTRLNDIMIKERWIIDGNYIRTLPQRLGACDTVFLLDYPTDLCLAGVEARIGKAREDMPWIEKEFDLEFRQWIIDFERDQLPMIYELLEKFKNRKNIIVFKTRSEAAAYIEKGEK